ncbi:MAG: hypothetical protein ACH34X_18325, partial [Thiolinea sp.]
DKGDQGIQGVKGDKGDQGIQGVKGDKGDQGIQGVKGDKGDQGIQGIQGPAGADGSGGGDPLVVKYPSLTARFTGVHTTEGQAIVFSQFVEGELFTTTTGEDTIIPPAAGRYYVEVIATARHTVAGAPALLLNTLLDGATIPLLGFNFGVNYFPYMAANQQDDKTKARTMRLSTSNKITVVPTDLAAGAEVIGVTVNLTWISA